MNTHPLLALVPLLSGAAPAADWTFGGSVENTLWATGDVPAAFLGGGGGALYAPRLSLSLDYHPDPYWFFHATVRADRGFDPGTRPDGEVRLDELILRYRPLGDARASVQIGKFPTVVGNWIPTHGFYDDPFLLAPLPYSTINGVNLRDPSENSPAAIGARSRTGGATIHRAKQNWSSTIWGPAYSNGLSLSGNTARFDYAFEVKNAALGSQPEEWDFGDGDFGTPNVALRLGYRPGADWALGVSAAHGHYLNEDATTDRSGLTQTLLGLDLRWSSGDWIVSGEAFLAHYETLHEDFRSVSYYLQARYKAAPGVWVAGRFGQVLSNQVAVPGGGEEPWSPDVLRGELALGWRVTPSLLLKMQYAHTLVTNGLSEPSENLAAFSLGWRF